MRRKTKVLNRAEPHSGAIGRAKGHPCKIVRSKSKKQGNIWFITGTGTGVGKTVLTSLLLAFARQKGISACGIKPFCSGDREDVRVIQEMNGVGWPDDEVNPWFFKQPVTPLLGIRKHQIRVEIEDILGWVNGYAEVRDLVLVEGAGGLLSPLAEGISAREIIQNLRCGVIVVAKNRLGMLNEVRLTLAELERTGVKEVILVVMEEFRKDAAAEKNISLLQELESKTPIIPLKYQRNWRWEGGAIENRSKKIQKTLARIWMSGSFVSVASDKLQRGQRSGKKFKKSFKSRLTKKTRFSKLNA